MIALVTREEMRGIDAAATEPVEVLIERAGAAVARAALEMLGGAYGRRVVVVAGKGNNGADGRAAAARLRARGMRVEEVDPLCAPRQLPPADLVIDAAYGTGFRGEYDAPDPAGAPVLAVDIPSGVDGNTGEACEGAVRAVRTVTFAALKPGLLLADGPDRAGAVTVADIGLEVSAATAGVVEEDDLAAWLPGRPRDAHKWLSAVWVVAGSAGMDGAAHLCAHAAMRAGAGTVRLGVPGGAAGSPFLEVVGRTIPASAWAADALADAERCKAVVVGPGLGRADTTRNDVRIFVAGAPQPVVVDADGLFALGTADDAAAVLHDRGAGTVLTPHEGEFARLAGTKPGADRLADVRRLAERTGATVLLKGSTTIVASPGGATLVVTAGDSRLATAGTGDVLSGVIGAFLAQGLDPLRAAALAAYVHGAAARLGTNRGFVASDLPDLLPLVLNRSAAP